MAHIVRKKVNGTVYLSVQTSKRKGKKVSTKHIIYLGKERNYTKTELKSILAGLNGGRKK